MHVQEYAERHPHEEKGTPLGSTAAPPDALYMPTRAELHANGRHDLQRAIAAAGGSLAVAQVRQSAPSRNKASLTLSLETAQDHFTAASQHLHVWGMKDERGRCSAY